MQEYMIDDFRFETVLEESHGSWEQSRKDPDKGMFVVNYSSILTFLIQTAGRICRRYASDLFIDWLSIDKALYDKAYGGGRYLFGFREDGIDHAEYVLGRINGFGMEHFANEIQELYMLDVKVDRAERYPDDMDISMCFGRACLAANTDSRAA